MQIRLNQQPEITKPSAPRRRPGMTILVKLLAYISLAWIAWCTAMYFFQDKLVFPRDMAPEPLLAIKTPPQNLITITTKSGQPIEAWFYPAKGVDAAHPAPVVLYFHGNAEIIDLQDRVLPMWYRLGVSVLTPEYRGYGRAAKAGKPSERSLVSDGVRFYDELIRRPDVDRSRVIIQGYSIGGGVAAQVAAKRKPVALVLEATFTSIADFAWGYGVPPFLTRYPFHTDEVLPQLGVPIFISHGRADTIVPVSHGRRLHALVPESTYLELSCGHLDMPGETPSDGYGEQIRAFLIGAGVLPPVINTNSSQPNTQSSR